MEKLILLKPRERTEAETWIDKELSSVAEEIQTLKKRGADPMSLLFHLGRLMTWIGYPECNAEQYIEGGERHG